MSGTGKSLKFVKATGSSVVDSLLTGDAWVGTITYAFPTWRGSYGYGFENYYGFTSISAAQAKTALFAMEQSYGSAANDGFSVEGFTNASFKAGSASTATIRFAQSWLPDTAFSNRRVEVKRFSSFPLGAAFDVSSRPVLLSGIGNQPSHHGVQ